MYLLQKPSDERIRAFVDAQARLDLTYSQIGSTQHGKLPPKYVVDENRIRLGAGLDTFNAAKRALCSWRHYEFGWIELYRPVADPEPGQTVAVLARALGLWVLNACRVVYVLEEDAPLRRFAFAYGTLPEHAESGEERFQVQWHQADDSVWYEILAFSRPNQWFSRMALPYVRHKQKQFARDSLLAMKAAVAAELATGSISSAQSSARN